MSPSSPSLNPVDWITVASWPTSTSVWNPALNFAGSYGLSSTTASAFRVNVFCCRSYSRPTMVVPPTLWPEYEYDPSAKPVSLNPASVVSRWFTGGAGGWENRLDRRLHERLRHRHLEPHFFTEFEHHGPAAIVLQHLVLAAVATHPIDRDPGDAGPEQGGLHLRQPLGADHRGDEFHLVAPLK